MKRRLLVLTSVGLFLGMAPAEAQAKGYFQQLVKHLERGKRSKPMAQQIIITDDALARRTGGTLGTIRVKRPVVKKASSTKILSFSSTLSSAPQPRPKARTLRPLARLFQNGFFHGLFKPFRQLWQRSKR